MPFSRPTLQQIANRIIADLNTEVDNSSSFLRRSVFYVFSKIFAAAVHLLYGNIDFNKRQLFTMTADAEYLDIHGNEYGIARKVGTKATGNVTASGTNGTVIPAGTSFQGETGYVYTTNAAATIASGTALIAITAEDYGNDYDEAAGATLSFVSPISGVNSTVTIDSSGIAGGVDAETDEEYRTRILTRKQQPPHGGADFDYVNWMLEVDGVTRAWCIPQYQGAGTIGLAFVRDEDTNIFPTAAQITTVENYIINHNDPETNLEIGMPITAQPGLHMISLTPYTVNMTIRIYLNNATVRASVQSRLEDLFLSAGGPGEAISISQLYEAIVSATDESSSRIEYPLDDIAPSTTQVPVLGTITFLDY